MTNLEILEALERGDISAKKAASLLKKNQRSRRGGGRIMRLKIRDGEQRLHIPLPLFLVYGAYVLGKATLKIGAYFDKGEGTIRTISDSLESISDADMKALIDSLGQCRSEGFVEVHDGDSHVVISVD
ncbi:MAG: hypothetical protein ACOX6S_00145 [Clostridia bacterium]|jgi:hypothetical protein